MADSIGYRTMEYARDDELDEQRKRERDMYRFTPVDRLFTDLRAATINTYKILTDYREWDKQKYVESIDREVALQAEIERQLRDA